MRLLLPLLLMLLCSLPARAEAPQEALTVFLRALYTGDTVALRASVLPGQQVERLGPVRPRDSSTLEEELRDLDARQEGPFLSEGLPVAGEAPPAGSRVTWSVVFQGSFVLIPTVLTSQGWKVDARFFLAPAETPLDSPEGVVRQFVWFLLKRDAARLAELATKVPPLAGEPPFEDQYYALAEEMPVAAALPGEVLRFPGGERVRVPAPGPDRLFLIGQYGVMELPFELRRVEGVWRVVARDYLSEGFDRS